MDDTWTADIESARWDGRDIRFEAEADGSRWAYAIAAKHLVCHGNSTVSEVLQATLPSVQHELASMPRTGPIVHRLA